MTAPLTSSARILVADDVALMRRLLSSYLRDFGRHDIQFAANGLEVMEAFRRGPIDLLFLDLDMPEMSGLEALLEIFALAPETFVVIVSSQGTMKNLLSTVEFGAKGFVVKPYAREKIREILHKFARERPVRVDPLNNREGWQR